MNRTQADAPTPSMSWRFLCAQHRHYMEQNPESAKRFWGEAVLAAREQSARLHWQQALTTYGNALEVATILLHRDEDRKRAELRYSRTAVEFIYALRRVDRRCDANLLLQIASCELEAVSLVVPKNELLEPLIEALACDRHDVSDWMNRLPRMGVEAQGSCH